MVIVFLFFPPALVCSADKEYYYSPGFSAWKGMHFRIMDIHLRNIILLKRFILVTVNNGSYLPYHMLFTSCPFSLLFYLSYDQTICYELLCMPGKFMKRFRI